MDHHSQACPICNNLIENANADSDNICFLEERAKEGKLNASLSLAKIVWENIPQLRHIADSELLDGLAKTMTKNFQQEANKILEPIKLTIETLPKILEGLPDDLRVSIQTGFDESRATLERQFKTVVDFSPKPTELMNSIHAVFEQINQANKIRLTELEQDLAMKFKGTLEKMGFPEPEQLKLLSRLLPATLPLLEELLRFQKVPADKGLQGELDLIQELQNYYPEDDSKHIGNSGDIDIMSTPRLNGTSLGQRVLIESKKNNSGWKRSFIEQVRTHMQLRGERFAILTVEVMPRGSNNFFIENCSEGMILVTDRSYFNVCYGAVRSALIALQPFLHRDEIDFRKLFAEKKISEAIDEACQYSEWTKKLREKAQRIDTNTKGLLEDVNQLDSHLRRSLQELQARINDAVVQIEATETKPVISRS